MVREITEGIYWIQGCHTKPVDSYKSQQWYEPGHQVHSCNSAYLIKGDDTLLFDTLAPKSRTQILKELENILDGEPLDYLVPSHPENPHAGNTLTILEKYPKTTLVAPAYGKTHELYHLDDSLKVSPGDRINLGWHEVEFKEAMFLDHYMHIWMCENTTNVLFCVDWLGLPHLGNECLCFVDEIKSTISVERFSDHPDTPFFWLKFADVEKINARIEEAIEEYNSPLLAPAHGLVIRENSEEYMRIMKDVFGAICENRTVVM